MQKVVVQLRTEAYPAEDDDLAHLSPARFEHRSRLGKYPFAEQEDLLRNGLRPLRQPTQAAAPTVAIAEGHFSPRWILLANWF